MSIVMGLSLKTLVRQNILWRYSIEWVFSPLHYFVWLWGINLMSRLDYLKSDLSGRCDPDLAKNSIRIVKGDPQYTEIAHLLRRNIEKRNSVERACEELRNDRSRVGYGTGLWNQMPADVRDHVVEFALQPETITPIARYLGLSPRLSSISLMLNIPRADLPEEGSKAWHRDADHFKCMNIFLCISDVDDESGPYHVIPRTEVPYHALLSEVHRAGMLMDWATSGRFSDEEMFPYLSSKDVVLQLKGVTGTAALTDPGLLFHKGGNCKSKNRIMMQISYVTDAAPSIQPGDVNESIQRLETAGKIKHPVSRYAAHLRGTLFANFLRALGTQKLFYKIGRKLFSYEMPLKQSAETGQKNN